MVLLLWLDKDLPGLTSRTRGGDEGDGSELVIDVVKVVGVRALIFKKRGFLSRPASMNINDKMHANQKGDIGLKEPKEYIKILGDKN